LDIPEGSLEGADLKVQYYSPLGEWGVELMSVQDVDPAVPDNQLTGLLKRGLKE